MGDEAVASICTTPRVAVLGCAIDVVTLDEAVAAVEARGGSREPRPHVAIKGAKLVRLKHDQQLRDVVAGCELVTADGQAVVWASRVLRRALPEGVTGIQLIGPLLAPCGT